MTCLSRLLLAVAFPFVAAPASAAPPAAPAKDARTPAPDYVAQLGLGGFKEVRYQDPTGKPLTRGQFAARIGKDGTFSILKDKGGTVATLRVMGAADAAREKEKAAPKLAVAPGKAMPPLARPDLQGKAVRYGDGPTLLSFFFESCLPCIQEVPKLNRLAKANPSVRFVSVTFDEVALARAFVAKYGLKTRVVADAQPFIDAVGVRTYPYFALVGRDGHLLGTQSSLALQASDSEPKFQRWLDGNVRK